MRIITNKINSDIPDIRHKQQNKQIGINYPITNKTPLKSILRSFNGI